MNCSWSFHAGASFYLSCALLFLISIFSKLSVEESLLSGTCFSLVLASLIFLDLTTDSPSFDFDVLGRMDDFCGT